MSLLSTFNEWRRPPATLEQLSRRKIYPVLSSVELVDLLGQKQRIRSIYQLASSGKNNFDGMYLPALDAYIEACQLQPASAAHHHAGLGGLIVHTLEVVEYALKQRKKYLLPENSQPEVISLEEHDWTYAVFAAALLHDAGKLLTLTKLRLDSDTAWTPVGPKLKDMGFSEYSIEFVRSPYNMQTRVSIALFDLLPPLGRNQIALNQTIFSQLTAYLSGDKHEMGVLGKIVGAADRLSTGANIDSDKTQVRIATDAPLATPKNDLIIAALRGLIHDGTLRANRNGAPVWYVGQYLYVISKPLADAIKQKLLTDGFTEKLDASEIFDSLQDAGHALKNDKGLGVHNIKITGEDNDFENVLSALKFEAARILHPDTDTEEFSGTIVEVSSRSKNTTGVAEIDVLKQAAPTNEPPNKQLSASSSSDKKQGDSSNTEVAPKSEERAVEQTLSDTTAIMKALSEGNTTTTIDTGTTTEEQAELDISVEQKGTVEQLAYKPIPSEKLSKHDEELERVAREINNKSANAAIQGNNKNVFSKACKLSDPDIGGYFMSWLKDGIMNGTLTMNRESSQIHIIKEGVALVSPKIFKRFIRENGLVDVADEKTIESGSKRVQTRLRKLKVLHLTQCGHGIHKLDIVNNPDKQLNVFVVKKHFLYPGNEQQPGINSIMKLAPTFHAGT